MQADLFAGVASTVMHRPSKPAQAGSIPVARSTDQRGKRDTSRAAYHALRDAGQLAPREHEVYAYLCRHAEQDFTRAELARALGRTHGAMCGRIFSLLEYGLVVETARRECAVTMAQAHGVKCK